jgi:hypothetical protein
MDMKSVGLELKAHSIAAVGNGLYATKDFAVGETIVVDSSVVSIDARRRGAQHQVGRSVRSSSDSQADGPF